MESGVAPIAAPSNPADPASGRRSPGGRAARRRGGVGARSRRWPGSRCGSKRGEIVLLRGPNGAGKTTLLRLCAGLLPVARGSGTVAGCDLVTQRDEVRARVEPARPHQRAVRRPDGARERRVLGGDGGRADRRDRIARADGARPASPTCPSVACRRARSVAPRSRAGGAGRSCGSSTSPTRPRRGRPRRARPHAAPRRRLREPPSSSRATSSSAPARSPAHRRRGRRPGRRRVRAGGVVSIGTAPGARPGWWPRRTCGSNVAAGWW
ncbi:MAG: ATP-binding cassette domain-containing protein [Ilumatobacteraceae bacterium]